MQTNEMKKQDAVCFVKSLIARYYGKRDMAALTACMREQSSWIGIDGEVCRNLHEAKAAMAQELREYSGGFSVTDENFEFIALSDSAGIVYGTLCAMPLDPTLAGGSMSLSAALERSGEGFKLLHMHFSHAGSARDEGAHFVKQAMREDNDRLRKELNIRLRQLANLMNNIPGGAHQCVNDPHLTLLSMSDGFLSMFGYTKEEVETQFEGKFLNMVYPGDRARLIRATYDQLENGSDIEIEYRVFHKHKQPIWVLDKGRLIDDGSGNRCFYCVLIDVTERQRQQEELRLSLERHQVIMDQATDTIFEWDILRDTLEFSSNWKKKFGYDPINHDISGAIPLSQNIHPEDMPAFQKIMKVTSAGEPYSETEFRIRDVNEKYYWCRIRATTQYSSDNRPIKAVGVIVDIDEEKKQKQILMEKAQYDTLTGIYNKATINALVEQQMRGKYASCKDQGYQALFIIDVDYFKAVNDTFGHLCGDSVLSDVAVALKGCTRSSDLVGRIGGDEFLVYFPEVSNEEAARKKAEQILKAVSCIRPEPGAAPITCSTGAVVLPHGEVGFETLYRRADRALYQRKNSRRGGATFYSAENGKNELEFKLSDSAVGQVIVSDEGNVADEWLAQYTFRTLYEAKDTEATLNRLLEIIGRSFDVSRAYIFESSADGRFCSNTFEWCGDGVVAQMESLQNIAYVDELGDYQKNFDAQGIFYCHDIESLHPDVVAILEPQQIRSMLQCAILDEGKFMGYVGFDECRENKTWNQRQVASFKLTADVLSTFLIKLRQKQRNK